MADPLSVSASVIAVTTLAAQSCKALNDIITSFVNAPRTLRDLRGDLSILQHLIQSLESVVGDVERAQLSVDQRICIAELVPAMQNCQGACDDFKAKLSKITSHSKEDQVSWVDRSRIHFNEKEILLLKSRLRDCKETLDVALGVVTLKTMTNNQERLHAFETQVAETLSNLAHELQGPEFAVKSPGSTTLSISNQNILAARNDELLNEHGHMLRECLRVCTAGLAETTAVTGTRVKYAHTFDEARQWIGNIGDIGTEGPIIDVGYGAARGNSRQGIGHMSADAAKDFFR